MVLTFKKEFVPLILKGVKTQTRRLWKRQRLKEGKVYSFRTNRFRKESEFCKAKIKKVWREKVKDISLEDVLKEGFSSRMQFFMEFARINGLSIGDALAKEVYVIEFEMV